MPQATTATIEPGTTLFELADDQYLEWYVVDVYKKPQGFAALLTGGDRRMTVDADDLGDAIASDSPKWVPAMYEYDDQGDTLVAIPHPRRADETADPDQGVDVDRRVAPDSPKDLSFERVGGRGSRTEVNAFLEGAEDGLVDHELGGVASWKTAFVARYDGAIVSAVVLHHYHPSTNGVEIAITRVANHPSAPANTSSWVIARARKWAERAGYERVATYAGVGGNGGTCYQAAGFRKVGEPQVVDGKDWKGERGGTWVKQKYVYDLEPETYDGWSEADATASVEIGGEAASTATA